VVDGSLLVFTRRAKDVLSAVAATDQVKIIDFLNTNEQSTLEGLARKMDYITVQFNGGFELADRRRAIIFPTFMSAESIDAKVSLFKIEVIGSGEITHSQVLGSLMSLAINRSVIGDIVVNSDGAFFASCSEFDDFLVDNFTMVGRYNIRLELLEEIIVNEQKFAEMEIIVSSMRLDVVVSALINASRSKAAEYLEAGFVRLNHAEVKKVSRICRIGDVLSIRKHGRFKIVENKKTTKRGKFVVVVNKNM